MKNELIEMIMQKMLPYLDNAQLERLQDVLDYCMHQVTIEDESSSLPKPDESNEVLMMKFLSAKRVEGLSEKTIRYYEATLSNFFSQMTVSVLHMKTEHIREYLSQYREMRQCGKSNIDNIRRILSSFFSWLEEESFILADCIIKLNT